MVKQLELDMETIFDTIEDIQKGNNTQELLKKNIPAYIRTEKMSKGTILKIYPDGREEIVTLDECFSEKILNT